LGLPKVKNLSLAGGVEGKKGGWGTKRKGPRPPKKKNLTLRKGGS